MGEDRLQFCLFQHHVVTTASPRIVRGTFQTAGTLSWSREFFTLRTIVPNPINSSYSRVGTLWWFRKCWVELATLNITDFWEARFDSQHYDDLILGCFCTLQNGKSEVSETFEEDGKLHETRLKRRFTTLLFMLMRRSRETWGQIY